MKAAYRLTVAVAAVMLAQSSLGLLYRGQYRDVEWIAATWLGNDWVTLVVALPLLAAGTVLAEPRVRARTAALGRHAGIRAIQLRLLPLRRGAQRVLSSLSRRSYHGGAGADPCAVAHCASWIARRFNDGTPVRLIGGYFVVRRHLARGHLAGDVGGICVRRPADACRARGVQARRRARHRSHGSALAIGGVLLWRRNAWGYVVVRNCRGSRLALSAGAVDQLNHRGRAWTAEGPGELPMWGSLATMTAAATLLLLANAWPLEV